MAWIKQCTFKLIPSLMCAGEKDFKPYSDSIPKVVSFSYISSVKLPFSAPI